ncbi:MAG: glycoside hydrolase family 16 protein [Bacteroidia bacterium]|nr:glycoside hydrolase family 16 protein [Bacteroidia bacterium]
MTGVSVTLFAQKNDPFKPDFKKPVKIKGMKLVWNDEFNIDGKPDPANWIYETGFVRNQELQWYQPENANCKNGLLVIEGKREKVSNPNFIPGSSDWKTSRDFAEYTSACIKTRGLQELQFGRVEMRARIDTACGSWPAFWTLGTSRSWPSCGEIDIMEFYRIKTGPIMLANFAWGTNKRGVAKWDDIKMPLKEVIGNDSEWAKKFHLWRMDWDKDTIKLYLDNRLMNSVAVSETINPDGFNPFHQPHYILINQALGANGGDPSGTPSPFRYEVDWVRVYQ